MINIEQAINQLSFQGKAIIALVTDLSVEQVRWKPDPESWSVIEVLNHLVDEEMSDFRQHLDHLLHTPEAPWPNIDPQGWVTERAYQEHPLGETLVNFEAERNRSIAWLKELTSPDWKTCSNLPWGALSAGDMLASWLAHDLLHLRQLIELKYALTTAASDPFSADYAGEW